MAYSIQATNSTLIEHGRKKFIENCRTINQWMLLKKIVYLGIRSENHRQNLFVEIPCGEIMAVHNLEVLPIPQETIRAARSVFSRNHFYLQIGDHLGSILQGLQFDISESSSASQIGGAIHPLVTFFQFFEDLTDEQAMNAARNRLDWKYALHLPVNTLAFHQQALCEFRQKMMVNPASQCQLQKLGKRLETFNPPETRDKPDSDPLAFLVSVCTTNQAYWAIEAMYASLGILAARYPEWLRQVAKPHWYGRFSNLTTALKPIPPTNRKNQSIEDLYEDIEYLIREIQRSEIARINEIPEILVLQRIWAHRYQKKNQSSQEGHRISTWFNCDSCINQSTQKEVQIIPFSTAIISTDSNPLKG